MNDFTGATMLISTSRITYDFDFINAGCPVEDYDPFRDEDNTVATYSTNFIIAFFSFLFAIMIFLGKFRHESKLLAYYLMGTGLGFGIAGIGHVVKTREDDPGALFFAIGTYLPITLGCIGLILPFLHLYGIDRSTPSSATWKKVVWWSVIIIISLLGIICSILKQFLILALFFLGCKFAAFVIYFQQAFCQCKKNKVNNDDVAVATARRRRIGFVIKGLGFLIMLVGSIIQALLAPLCGKGGYEDCFEKCPLPAPTFNHNALFHVLYLIGLIVFGWSEVQEPSVKIMMVIEDESKGTKNQRDCGEVNEKDVWQDHADDEEEGDC